MMLVRPAQGRVSESGTVAEGHIVGHVVMVRPSRWFAFADVVAFMLSTIFSLGPAETNGVL